MDDELAQMVREELKRRNTAEKEQRFQRWCHQLDQLPKNNVPRLNGQLRPDLEIQPRRWLSHAMSIIESAHVTARVQHMDGRQGEPLSSFLPYPVFQMGTETFLKGMLLCRFAECRRVAHDSYVNPKTRTRYLRKLKTYGHDLLKLIRHLRRLGHYRKDASVLEFLNRIEAITRYYYHPLYEADAGSWAAARYPKRFYNDTAKVAAADAHQSFPEQTAVLRLFRTIDRHLDKSWQLTKKLAERRRTQRAKSSTRAPT